MPLPQNTVTKEEFQALMGYITLERSGFEQAAGYANSGLQYVVLMQRVTPEVDLLQPHAAQFLNLETQNTTTSFTSVVNSINTHVAVRGTTALAGETLSTRLNRWLWCQGVRVTRAYYDISAAAGWTIDPCNLRSDDNDNESTPPAWILDSEGNVIAVGCTATSAYYVAPAPGSGCPTSGGTPIGIVSP